MTDLAARIEGRAGRITLQRPKALNALTYDMVLTIEQTLDAWRDADIDLVILDAIGDRAFCSGGDISQMYESGLRGDLEYGRQFWRDEYRLNAKIFEYPKPIVSFLQGFTMGGGVGVGCHGAHRIVCETSQIAMPECGIGLVPDVGGSLMLAKAPGLLGDYLGTTGFRMGPADAIYAGFADHFLPLAEWDAAKSDMIATGSTNIPAPATALPAGTLAGNQARIDALFAGNDLSRTIETLRSETDDFAVQTLKALLRNAPLAMTCCTEILNRLRPAPTIRSALGHEFAYTYRAVAQGDFIEGIRAAIIDRDRSPTWAHDTVHSVSNEQRDTMLGALGPQGLIWENLS